MGEGSDGANDGSEYGRLMLTLSRLGARLVRVLSLAIYISPKNGAISSIQIGKVVVNVLAMHCAL